MTKEFIPDTINTVYGSKFQYDSNKALAPTEGRTPLHVEFSSRTNCEPSQVISATDLNDPERFNAIGSKVLYSKKHKPVIDGDGGVKVEHYRNSSKVILPALYKGAYGPNSKLRDVLGDHDIDLEVFETPKSAWNSLDACYEVTGMHVAAIVLRSRRSDVFQGVDSSTENHGHLYIQTEFEDYEHRTLIQELGALGVVSPAWRMLTEQEGMGIVRTPWTEKEITHLSS
jgi:hypothetical protein